MSKGTDLNEHMKSLHCRLCDGRKVRSVPGFLLCPVCDVAVLTLQATSLGKRIPPADG